MPSPIAGAAQVLSAALIMYGSNPSVAPDGETLAFQLSIDGEVGGEGDGILLLDLRP